MSAQASGSRPPRALVLHESMFGNTATLATELGEELEAAGYLVDVLDVAEAPSARELAVDLLVLGAPTHAFSLSRAGTRADAVRQGAPAEHGGTGLRDWLEDAHDGPPARAIPVAAFDTRVTTVRHLPGSAAHKAARLAHRAGLTPDLGTESFYVEDVKGPLAEGELDRVRAWGRRLVERVPTGPGQT